MVNVELVIVFIGMEKDMPCHEKKEDAWYGRVNKEKASGTLKIGGLGIIDGNPKSSGEGFVDDGDGVGSDGGFIQ